MVLSTCVAVAKAVITRTAFAAHSLLVVWRVTDVTGNWHHWFLLMGNVLLLAELLYTCIKRKGQEWKWYVSIKSRNHVYFFEMADIFTAPVVPCKWKYRNAMYSMCISLLLPDGGMQWIYAIIKFLLNIS